jgi:hypothetical protein
MTRQQRPDLVGVAAAGLLVAGLFRTDPITVPVDAYTDAGRLHMLGASVDDSLVGVLLTGWRQTRRPLLAAAAVSTALMTAFVVALPHDGRFNAGLIGRPVLIFYVGWITIAATAVIRRRCEAPTEILGALRPQLTENRA